MSTQASAAVTAEELAALPDDGWRRELVDGELVEMRPAGFEHGEVALAVGSLLREHVRRAGLGRVVAAETGFRLSRSPDTIRAADAAFVAARRLPAPEQRTGFLDLAPDLAVEVVSPSDRASDVLAKASAWLTGGSAAVWVVYPAARTVAVHTAGGHVRHLGVNDVLTGGGAVPGFEVLVSELFS
jgi:Uma2 family endonuclease